MMKSIKQREQWAGYSMADYNQDETRRFERRQLGQYDPQMRYTETLGYNESKFDDITKPEHYCAGYNIEPLDYIQKNGLDFLEGNIIKYVSRYDMKGGVKDLEKARFYLDRLIEREKEKRDS